MVCLPFLQALDNSKALDLVKEYQYDNPLEMILAPEKYGKFDIVETYTRDLRGFVFKSFAVDTSADEVCGYVEFEDERKGEGYIETLLVEEDYQRKGIGSYLLRRTLQRYYQRFHLVRLFAIPLDGYNISLEDLIKFYQKNGGVVASRGFLGADIEFRSSERDADSDPDSSAHASKKPRA